MIECAYQIWEESPEVCIIFLRANNELELVLSYSEFASRAKISTDDNSLLVSCENVKKYLDSDEAGKWLTIVDGLDNADALFGPNNLHKYLPQSKNGSIVFTTRNKQLAHEFVPLEERVIQLNRLSDADALKLLQIRVTDSKGKRQALLDLIELLEGLPLALSQASSFISRNCYSIDRYVQLYRQSEITRIELLNEGGVHLDGSLSNPITKTWQMSFKNIGHENSLAAHILSLGACFHHQQIPLSLLPMCGSIVKVIAALGLLRAYSMITSDPGDDHVTMHSLVPLITRNWLRSEAQLEKYMQLSFDAVYRKFPECFECQAQLQDGDQYSLHARTVLTSDLIPAQGPRQCYVLLASRTSRYFRAKSEYEMSLTYAKTALEWSNLTCGEQDACTLNMISDLAVANWYRGDYKEARNAAEKALDLRRQVLGHDHIDTVASLSNLGLIRHAQGEYEAAEEIQRRALDMREKTLGLTHNDTLKSLNNLGLSLKRQHKYEEAEKAFRRVSTERQNMFGKAHAGTLVSMNNLGLVLELQGRYTQSLDIHSEVLRAREALYGTRHPQTLKSKLNIVVVLRKQDRLGRAEIMTKSKEVLAEYMQVLGDKHDDVLYAMSSLAILHQEHGNYRDAECLSRQVFEAKRAALGEDHPDVIFSKNKLEDLKGLLERDVKITMASLRLD